MKQARRFLSMLLVALLGLAALVEGACFADTPPASVVASTGDAGNATQLPDADDVCQHGHHHQMPLPALGEKGLTLAVCPSDAIFPSEPAHASLLPASLERPPRI